MSGVSRWVPMSTGQHHLPPALHLAPPHEGRHSARLLLSRVRLFACVIGLERWTVGDDQIRAVITAPPQTSWQQSRRPPRPRTGHTIVRDDRVQTRPHRRIKRSHLPPSLQVGPLCGSLVGTPNISLISGTTNSHHVPVYSLFLALRKVMAMETRNPSVSNTT